MSNALIRPTTNHPGADARDGDRVAGQGACRRAHLCMYGGLMIMIEQQPSTNELIHALNEMVRALALAQRDKALADARQAMKMVRAIEKQYKLNSVSIKEEK
jgi:hypothetical protein